MEPGVGEGNPPVSETPAQQFSPPAIQTLRPLPVAADRQPRPVPRLAPRRPGAEKKYVIAGSAVAGLLILGGYYAYRAASATEPPKPVEIVEHLDPTELQSLPESLQANAKALLAGTFQPPAWLQSLERGSGGDLGYPVQEGIDDVQPTLRWSSSANSYHVAVMGPTHQVVARTEIFGSSEWLLPVELARGSVYTWEVVSLGQVRRNHFRVLDETESELLNTVRMAHGDSHLLMGVTYLQLGMLSAGQKELEALTKDHPHSPEAAQLLRTANALLGR
jgi:hypothetical protein